MKTFEMKGRFMKNSPDQKGRGKMDDQFGGSYPRYSGAIDAVTDGPPEDINQMPPAVDQSSKASNIDLSREERSILVQLLHDRLGSLREEIHHSDTPSFTDDLKKRQKEMEHLLRRFV